MKKFVEIKPYTFREYKTISDKVEKRITDLQKDHKVLSVNFSGFNSVVTIVYRKTVWKAFKDYFIKKRESKIKKIN